ncbi:hypothetical protein [Trinickia sp. EG282A]
MSKTIVVAINHNFTDSFLPSALEAALYTLSAVPKHASNSCGMG